MTRLIADDSVPDVRMLSLLVSLRVCFLTHPDSEEFFLTALIFAELSDKQIGLLFDIGLPLHIGILQLRDPLCSAYIRSFEQASGYFSIS